MDETKSDAPPAEKKPRKPRTPRAEPAVAGKPAGKTPRAVATGAKPAGRRKTVKQPVADVAVAKLTTATEKVAKVAKTGVASARKATAKTTRTASARVAAAKKTGTAKWIGIGVGSAAIGSAAVAAAVLYSSRGKPASKAKSAAAKTDKDEPTGEN